MNEPYRHLQYKILAFDTETDKHVFIDSCDMLSRSKYNIANRYSCYMGYFFPKNIKTFPKTSVYGEALQFANKKSLYSKLISTNAMYYNPTPKVILPLGNQFISDIIAETIDKQLSKTNKTYYEDDGYDDMYGGYATALATAYNYEEEWKKEYQYHI